MNSKIYGIVYYYKLKFEIATSTKVNIIERNSTLHPTSHLYPFFFIFMVNESTFMPWHSLVCEDCYKYLKMLNWDFEKHSMAKTYFLYQSMVIARLSVMLDETEMVVNQMFWLN